MVNDHYVKGLYGPPYGAVCYRGGRYCNAYQLTQYPPNEKPVYRTVVTFPGN